MARQLLHGIIEAKIFEANISAMSGGALRPSRKALMKQKFLSWITKLPCCQCQPLEQVESSIGLGQEPKKLYATVDIEKARVGRTRVIPEETANPVWDEFFHIYCAHDASNIVFTVKADNSVSATLIGRAYLPVKDIMKGEPVDHWLPICDEERKALQGGDKIHIQLLFLDVSRDPANWGNGIGSPNNSGVPRTFFPQRRGCKVSLYQDAHVPDNFRPRISLAGGRYYEPHRCWEDIFDAINNAQKLIYIAGWSVNTNVALIRDPQRRKLGWDQSLGELLKRKASEGVRVLLLVWDDRTSVGLGPIKRDGLMATHDEDTVSYFKGTDVHCVLCPRNPDEGRSYVQDVETATMFTHHQKTVIVDYQEYEKMKILSFLGGIDLCDGRYDTQDHPLFRTLGTIHRADFHQPNFPGASIQKGGPREPWHDIHCRLEGAAAWDVLQNFEQRWRKQGNGDELLVNVDQSFTQEELEDPESWHVQVFRSIDGGAVVGFPETPSEAANYGLVTGKDQVMERSIQDAYIHAIRRAKNFIYIENQYFLGSSYGWKPDDIKVEDINALHLIPKELSLKITSKIEDGEQFAVYVVIPMWPEGIPESGSVQAILDWQRRTMEMMYADIALALQAKGLQANPKDYLSFFCLGNREMYGGNEYRPKEQPEPDTDYMRAQQARRFMIYVHAKMMIVDDEYIIIGSANINQRSMDGGRDTEIAMGAYQPNYLTSRNQPAKGQIHGFRLSLWFEHLRRMDDDFLQPQSLQCMRKVNQIAEQYWEMYADDALQGDLPGHLLSYPIRISDDGELKEFMEFFPDTKARIFGAKSNFLPPILTT